MKHGKARFLVSITDAELAEVERLADQRREPLGTILYEIVGRALRRRMR